MIAANLQKIRATVAEAAHKTGRTGEQVRLVAVTKNVSSERITEAAQLGVSEFGENRVQEALPKIEAFPYAHWHFIGHLQTNKVKFVAPRFHLIHSLDRLKLASALNDWGEKKEQVIRALVQVNISGEKSKYGLSLPELSDFLGEVCNYPFLKIEGLMTIAPYINNPEEVRPYFRSLYQCFASVNFPGVEMRYLSMGMSNDYKVAVEEGSNLVRIGSAFFGERTE